MGKKTQKVHVNLTLGNTKPESNKRDNASKFWCFTWNNYSENDIKTLQDRFTELKILYLFSKEIGAQGTPHLQGYIECGKRHRWTEFRLGDKIHWEKCKGTREENINYCSKELNEERSEDYYCNSNLLRPLDILKEKQLYDWQKDIINKIKEIPDKRTINWYWEPTGCKGKTTFCKYLSAKYGAIPLNGKKENILYCAAMFPSDIYVWDLERSMEDYISYGAIERIKTGYYMSSKYESKPVIRNCPHVYIFANFAPDLKEVSADMWNIVDLRSKSNEICTCKGMIPCKKCKVVEKRVIRWE